MPLLYLALEPTARRWLRRPGPYVAVAIGLLIFSPVIGWNAAHGWVSFAFQGGRAVGSARLRPDTLLAALVFPALYLFPWIWFRLVSVFIGRGRHSFGHDFPAADRFLLSQTVLPVGTFLLVACTRPVLPHWTLVGFLPLFPMAGQVWDCAFSTDPVRSRRRLALASAMPVLLAILWVFQAHTGFFQKGRPGGVGLVNELQDPTAEMTGWDTIAAELRRRGLLDRPDSFLFTASWYKSGQLAFATRDSRTPVLCYHPWDARSFAFWSDPEEWVGRDGILLVMTENTGEPERYDRWFTRIEPLGEFDVERRGAPLRKVKLYRCVQQTSAFPFDDLGRTIRPRHHPSESRVAVKGTEESREH